MAQDRRVHAGFYFCSVVGVFCADLFYWPLDLEFTDMTKDEALKQALVALENCYDVESYPADGDTPQDKAITAIKEALAQPEACQTCAEIHAVLDADESKIIRNAQDGYPEGRTPHELTLLERVTALCTYAADWKRWCVKAEALAQPEQEPVAHVYLFNHDGRPRVAWDNAKGIKIGDKLYTAPPLPVQPERPWVGLTDKAIWLEYQMLWPFHPAEEPQLAKDIVKFAKAIEAKLKEKK
jgi:hypothetical protein